MNLWIGILFMLLVVLGAAALLFVFALVFVAGDADRRAARAPDPVWHGGDYLPATSRGEDSQAFWRTYFEHRANGLSAAEALELTHGEYCDPPAVRVPRRTAGEAPCANCPVGYGCSGRYDECTRQQRALRSDGPYDWGDPWPVVKPGREGFDA